MRSLTVIEVENLTRMVDVSSLREVLACLALIGEETARASADSAIGASWRADASICRRMSEIVAN